jgi:hypothetical protein
MKKFLLFIAIAFVGINANAQAETEPKPSTPAPVAQLLAEYNFNNSSYADVNGNNPFASGSNIGFTVDRHGNANGALALNEISNVLRSLPNGTYATIPNLPIGNHARTISIWVLCGNTLDSNYYFSYGSAATNAAFGLGQFTTTTSTGGNKPTITVKNDLNFFGYGNDLVHTPYKANPTNWTHFVVTYSDTGLATIYINGALTAFAAKTGWHTVNSDFRLGQTMQGTNSVIAYYDDLKIYNRAISATEVSNLYSTNTILTTESFQTNILKPILYPNPTSTYFVIETENELKSVEIYSLLGQKVLTSTSRTVSVSSLCKGIYMVRVEDINNAASTQKLIVE